VSALESALLDLGRHLQYPPVEDLAPAVLDDIGGRRTAPRRMAVLAVATVALLVGGLALLSPGVRAALLRIFALPGVRIEVGTPEPKAPVQRLGEGLDLGDPVGLATARDQAAFPVRVPGGLGQPDRVFVEPTPAGRRVWLVYRARPGLPAAEETGVGLLVTEFRGDIGELLIKKVEAEGAAVMPIDVDGHRGFFIRGAHTLMFVNDVGGVIDDRTRVAGNVLIWVADGVVYRLESALGLVDSLEIARTLR
jgi:hypothetical protein